MKLKKYKVVVNQYGHYFNDGYAMGKEKYGFRNGIFIILIDKTKDVIGDDYSYYTFNSSDCIEVPDNDEEMPASTAPSFSSGNSGLLSAIGDKPSKITIEF